VLKLHGTSVAAGEARDAVATAYAHGVDGDGDNQDVAETAAGTQPPPLKKNEAVPHCCQQQPVGV
jgi:hypothetical protein